MPVTLRWLGVAGLEFSLGGYTLLVDPFFTRPSPWQVISPRGVAPDAALVARHIRRADSVLVTHAHYDHLLDVPEVLRQTGARAYGSRNTCDLLARHGFPAQEYSCISAGDRFELGPFLVEVFPARHTRTPLDHWINGPLPARITRRKLPLRLVDYRMDDCFSFRIHAAGKTFLAGNHPAPADVLLIAPFHSPAALHEILSAVAPAIVVPIHWENFTRSLSKSQRPMLVTRHQGWAGWPPVRRLDLEIFARRIEQIRPGVQVLIPEMFKEETLF
jgi:L-ascorbate metabolism protein UlaG (beta-lactamase superfamily)